MTIGPIPSSMRVPRFDAKITRRAPNWSEADFSMPKSGTSVMTKKTTRTSAVQKSFSLKLTLRSGFLISGKTLPIGLKRLRNLPGTFCFTPWWLAEL